MRSRDSGQGRIFEQGNAGFQIHWYDESAFKTHEVQRSLTSTGKRVAYNNEGFLLANEVFVRISYFDLSSLRREPPEVFSGPVLRMPKAGRQPQGKGGIVLAEIYHAWNIQIC